MFDYYLDKEISMSNQFNATMNVLGRPVVVLPGRIGTRLAGGEPAQFEFQCTGDNFIINVVGGEANGQYVGLDQEGYLCVSEKLSTFNFLDSQDEMLTWSNFPQGKAVVRMFTSDGSAIMQFGGDNAFEDNDTLYNFLIAGRKVRKENVRGDVAYVVPSGEDSWMDYPADKPYTAKPVQIVLDIK